MSEVSQHGCGAVWSRFERTGMLTKLPLRLRSSMPLFLGPLQFSFGGGDCVRVAALLGLLKLLLGVLHLVLGGLVLLDGVGVSCIADRGSVWAERETGTSSPSS